MALQLRAQGHATVRRQRKGDKGADAQQYALQVTGTRYTDSGTARSSYSVDGGTAVTNITTGGRGLTLLVFDADGVEDKTARQTFDTYLGPGVGDTMVTALRGLHDRSKVVAIVSMDAISMTYNLQTELKEFGGDDSWMALSTRTAYAFVGQYGMQRGTAYYTHAEDEDVTLRVAVNRGVLTARGEKGDAGATVEAQYSASGGTASTAWHATFRAGDVWMRTSSDGGKTWGAAIRIVGEKGADGAWTDYSFCAGASLTNPPSGGPWADAPVATTTAAPYLWMRVQKYSDATTKDGDASYVRLTGEKGDSGEKGDKGDQGLQGCIQRVTEWTAGVEFHNDEALTSGTRYLDIAVITGETPATFLAFKCRKTHVATTANAPKAGATTTEWQPMNNMAPIYTPLILAQYALLKFAQTNRLLIMKEDGTINAALGGGRWPLWVGGNSADEAPFAVDCWGNTKEAAALIPATNGANSYIVEDKGRMVFAPSSDMSSATFNVHLPNDSEYIGRRITVIVQPQIMSSGTTGGGAVAKITTGDRFVNCLYGGGTEKANVELIEAIGGDEKGYLDGLQYFGGGYVKAGTKAELPQTISLKNGHVELLGIEERVKNLWRTEVASGNGARWKAGIVRDSAGLIIDAESTGGFMETTEAVTEWEQEGDGYTRMCRWVMIDHTGAEFA